MSVATQLSELWAQVHSPSGLPFPSTVSKLLSLGVTRYHIDYVSLTATSYISTPTSPTTAFKSDIAKLPAEHLPAPLAATEFNKEALVAAIRKAQSMAIEGQSDYLGFAKECVQAGVTDYVAFLEGKKVLYMGARGETHTEWFPGAGPGEEK
jgi:uncharacterized protein YbcV (DUF1398 family)